MHGGDFYAVGSRKAPKDSVKRRKHLFDAVGSVIGDVGSSTESFGTRALKNQEVTFQKSAIKRPIERLHHVNVQDVERRAVESDPSRAMFEPKLNGFVMATHIPW